MTKKNYDINMDIRFGPLEHMDIAEIASKVKPWWNQTLTRVNDCVIRLGVIQGEFHWHKHDNEDEYFYVVDGKLFIDLEKEKRTVELAPKQGFMVPRGVVHRTRATEKTTMLMVEAATVKPTGD